MSLLSEALNEEQLINETLSLMQTENIEKKLSSSQRVALDSLRKKAFSNPYGASLPKQSGFSWKVLNSVVNLGLVKAEISEDSKIKTWTAT